jgi:acetyltransferase-like isoleucine patch superfamily enzyme
MSPLRRICALPGLVFLFCRKLRRRALAILLRPLFAKCGKNVNFDPDGWYSFSNIELGDKVFIAHGASFGAAIATIRIGNNVMFGPGVIIRGGNHNASVVGSAMADVHEKRPEDDLGVTIEDDVWVGAGATVLSGVTISRGSIVAAGAVVTKSFPPYSIIGGVPARVIRARWDAATILEHERKLYPESQGLIGRDSPPARPQA